MSDLLSALRREPPVEFSERLRARLGAGDVAPAGSVARPLWPVGRIAASLAVVAVAGALVSVPSVRASARSLLARFRVVSFVAVEVDESRFAALKSQSLDLPDLIGHNIQFLEDPGPAIEATSPEHASSLAGIDVRLPAWLPPHVEATRIDVSRAGALRVIADTRPLEQVMDFVGIHDLEVPVALNGKSVDVGVPAIVRIRYANATGAEAEFLQARSPEIALPEGVDLPALAEIGLRILGLRAAEARQFSRSIDWRTTLLVPLPPGLSSVRQIDVNGSSGIAAERSETVAGPNGPGARAERIVFWSGGGRVFGLKGNFSQESFLRMAHSLQ